MWTITIIIIILSCWFVFHEYEAFVHGAVPVTTFFPNFTYVNQVMNGRQSGKFTERNQRPNNFGGFPGPCRSTKAIDQKFCTQNFGELPESVRNATVDLGIFGNNRTLGSILGDGYLQLAFMQISGITLTKVEVDSAPLRTNATHAFFGVKLVGLKLDVSVDVDMKVANSGSFKGKLRLDKSTQTKGGTNATLEVALSSAALATRIPTNVSVPVCNLDLDLGLAFTNLDFTLGISFINFGGFADQATAIGNVLTPVIGFLACNLIDQLVSTEGLVGDKLKQLEGNLTVYRTAPAPNVNLADTAAFNALSSARKEKVLSFTNSTFVNLTDTVVNLWLGSVSKRNVAKYLNRLVINEAVDYMTDDTGEFKFEELKAAGAKITIPLNAIDATIEVFNFTIKGANTFNRFKALDYVAGRHFTLDHDIRLDDADMTIGIELTTSDGFWEQGNNLTSPRQNVTIRFLLDVSASNFSLIASTLTAIAPEELLTRQVGQLLGGSVSQGITFSEQALFSLRCASPALYNLSVSDLRVSFGDLSTPVIRAFPDAALGANINNGLIAGNNALEAALLVELPFIIQSFVRPRLNRFIQEEIVGKVSTCAKFVANTTQLFNFKASNAFLSAETLINKVVGGAPVRKTSTEINELVRLSIDNVASFRGWDYTPPPTSAQGTWVFRFSGVNISTDPIPTQPVGIVELQELRLEGVNSIYELLLTPISNNSFTFNFSIGNGQLLNPDPLVPTLFRRDKLKIGIKTLIQETLPLGSSSGVNTDEQTLFDITLSELDVNVFAKVDFDLNAFFKIKVEDLIKVDCLLAPFKDADIKVDIGLNTVKLNLTRLSLSGGQPSPLREAHEQLSTEFANIANDARFNAIVDKVLTSVGNGIANIINKKNFSDTSITVDNCALEGFKSRDIVFVLIYSIVSGEIAEFGNPNRPLSFTGVPENANFLDWNDHIIGKVIPSIVSQLNTEKYLNVLKALGNGTGSFLKDSLIEVGNSSITFDGDIVDLLGNFSLDGIIDGGILSVNRLRITNLEGLDFDNLKILKPVRSNVLNIPFQDFLTDTDIRIENSQNITLELMFDLPGDFFGEGGRLIERITVNMTIGEIQLFARTLIALDYDKVGALSFGHFFTVDTNQSFSLNRDAFSSCFFSLFFRNGLLIHDLEVSIGIFRNFVFSSNNGILSAGVEAYVNAVVIILTDLFIPKLSDITNGLVRNLINELILRPFVNFAGTCKPPSRPALVGDAQLLNFQTSDISKKFANISKSLAGDEGDYAFTNSIINGVMNTAFLFTNLNTKLLTDYEVKYKNLPLGRADIGINRIGFTNLGSISNLTLLNPLSKFNTFTQVSLDGPTVFSMEIRTKFIDIFPEVFQNDVKIIVDITGLDISANLTVQLNIVEFLEIELGQFTNLTQIPCVLRAFKEIKINKFSLDVDKVFGKLTCVGICNAPLLKGLQNGGELTTGNSETLANIITEGLEFIVNLLNSDSFAGDIADDLTNADVDCALALDLSSVSRAITPQEVEEIDVAVIFGLGFAGGMVGLCLALLLVIPRHFQKKKRYFEEALNHYKTMTGATEESVAIAMAKEQVHMLSIFSHPVVPVRIKFFVPIAIIGNLCFLLSSIFYLPSFTVDLSAYILGSQTKEIVLVPFSIRSTINDMWNSKAEPIALLIVGASCAWPILKNVLLFYLWVAPTTVLSKHTKHFQLEVLDLLGKWSMIDVYVVIIVVAALRISAQINMKAELDGLPDDLLGLESTATPQNGIILLALAAVNSLAINHVIIYWNEKTKFADKRLFNRLDRIPDDMLTPKAKIRMRTKDYVFSTTNEKGQHDRFSNAAKNQVTILLLCALVILIVLFFLPCFEFQYNGIVGVTLEFINEKLFAVREFNLVTAGIIVAEANKGTAESWFIVILFQVLYFITVIVFPVVQVILFLALWNRPYNYFEANTMMMWANISGYWASIEIFLVSLIATKIEIQKITIFMVNFITGGVCGSATDLLSSIPFLGELDGKCLDVVMVPKIAFYIGIPVAVLVAIINGIALRACRIALQDREFILENAPFEERYPYTYWQYKVANLFFIHSAAHHKPVKVSNVDENGEPRLSIMTRIKNACLGCVSCMSCTPAELKTTNGASKWNVAPPSSGGGKWNVAIPQDQPQVYMMPQPAPPNNNNNNASFMIPSHLSMQQQQQLRLLQLAQQQPPQQQQRQSAQHNSVDV